MSLKSLIQRLLDSRTTPAQAVSANGMDLAHVTDVPWTEGDQMTYVAPSNGYIKLWIQAVAGSASDLGCDITVNNHRLIGTSVKTVSLESGLWMKVKKADSIRFTKWGAPNPFQKVIEFIPSIGGGYNSFIRRALSCLRPSFNFLPKNSLLAEATGFLTNPIQLFKRRISRLQRQENGFLSSLLATGGSASKGLPRKFCLATGRFGRGAIQQRHLIKAFVSLSQKAGLWPTYYRQTPRAHTSSLLRVLVINNLQTGGALC